MKRPPLFARLERYLFRGLWAGELAELPVWRALPLSLARSAVLTVLRVREHEISLRAAALTYTTVLSLVPMLAFAFALAKGFGLYDSLIADVVEPFLDENFGPVPAPSAEAQAGEAAGLAQTIGPSNAATGADPAGVPAQAAGPQAGTPAAATGQAAEPTGLRRAADTVLDIVAATPVTGLGVFGLSVLVAAVVRLLTQVEAALNRIYGVLRPRPLLRRLTDYLALLMIAPALALMATAVKASSQSQMVLERLRALGSWGQFLDALLSLGPILVMATIFSVLYGVMPNTRIKFGSAVLGGCLAALIWSLVQELYVKAQLGVSSYNELYAGFAALPLFLFWLFLSWTSVLLGAEFAAADQDQGAYRHQALFAGADQSAYEAAVLAAVLRIAQAFESGRRPPSLTAIVDELDVPRERLLGEFERLEQAGILLRAEAGGVLSFGLARSTDRLRIADLLQALRGTSPDPEVGGHSELDRFLLNVVRRLERAQHADGANLDLRQLLREAGQTLAESSGPNPGMPIGGPGTRPGPAELAPQPRRADRRT
jgi:membrane protein